MRLSIGCHQTGTTDVAAMHEGRNNNVTVLVSSRCSPKNLTGRDQGCWAICTSIAWGKHALLHIPLPCQPGMGMCSGGLTRQLGRW